VGICQNIPAETCCANIGTLYGSAQADTGVAGAVAAPFTKQGNLYCGVQIGSAKPVPVCFVTGLDSSVGGIAWEVQAGTKRMEHQGRKRTQQLGDCKAQVQGDEIYSDGVNTYVISKEKMALVGSEKPVGEEELLEFFKTHADTVIDNQTDIPVIKVDVESTAEQK